MQDFKNNFYIKFIWTIVYGVVYQKILKHYAVEHGVIQFERRLQKGMTCLVIPKYFSIGVKKLRHIEQI
jgi:hypothetical protein